MIWWYLLAAYLGFGILTTVLMRYTDWRDGDLDETDGTLALPTVLLWPVTLAVVILEVVYGRSRRELK